MKHPAHGLALLLATWMAPLPLLAASLTDATVELMEKNLLHVFPTSTDYRPIELESKESSLTLDKALEIALQDNLGLQVKQVQLLGKQASSTASFREMLPTLSVSSSRTDILRNTTAYGSQAESFNTTLTLSQPIYRGGAQWSGWQSAETQRNQAKLDLIHTARTLIKNVKGGWYALLEKQVLLKEAQAALERLHQHEKNAQAFFKEGRMWRNEVLQANVKVAQGEQNLITAQNQVELAKAELNRLMRRSLDHPLKPEGELTWVPMEWTLEEAYAHAQKHRTDLEKARLDIQVGKLTEVSTASGTLPMVDFTGTYGIEAPESDYHKNDATLTAILSMSWTAWDWGKNSQQLLAAKANTARNQLTYDDQLQSVLLETRKAFLTAKESALKVEVLKKSLQQAKENYRVNQIRYREQLGSATDVLDAMDLLTTTSNTHTSAIAAYLTAQAALDLAVGKETPDIEIKP